MTQTPYDICLRDEGGATRTIEVVADSVRAALEYAEDEYPGALLLEIRGRPVITRSTFTRPPYARS